MAYTNLGDIIGSILLAGATGNPFAYRDKQMQNEQLVRQNRMLDLQEMGLRENMRRQGEEERRLNKPLGEVTTLTPSKEPLVPSGYMDVPTEGEQVMRPKTTPGPSLRDLSDLAKAKISLTMPSNWYDSFGGTPTPPKGERPVRVEGGVFQPGTGPGTGFMPSPKEMRRSRKINVPGVGLYDPDTEKIVVHARPGFKIVQKEDGEYVFIQEPSGENLGATGGQSQPGPQSIPGVAPGTEETRKEVNLPNLPFADANRPLITLPPSEKGLIFDNPPVMGPSPVISPSPIPGATHIEDRDAEAMLARSQSLPEKLQPGVPAIPEVRGKGAGVRTVDTGVRGAVKPTFRTFKSYDKATGDKFEQKQELKGGKWIPMEEKQLVGGRKPGEDKGKQPTGDQVKSVKARMDEKFHQYLMETREGYTAAFKKELAKPPKERLKIPIYDHLHPPQRKAYDEILGYALRYVPKMSYTDAVGMAFRDYSAAHPEHQKAWDKYNEARKNKYIPKENRKKSKTVDQSLLED